MELWYLFEHTPRRRHCCSHAVLRCESPGCLSGTHSGALVRASSCGAQLCICGQRTCSADTLKPDALMMSTLVRPKMA